jgi:hypothetical protein
LESLRWNILPGGGGKKHPWCGHDQANKTKELSQDYLTTRCQAHAQKMISPVPDTCSTVVCTVVSCIEIGYNNTWFWHCFDGISCRIRPNELMNEVLRYTNLRLGAFVDAIWLVLYSQKTWKRGPWFWKNCGLQLYAPSSQKAPLIRKNCTCGYLYTITGQFSENPFRGGWVNHTRNTNLENGLVCYLYDIVWRILNIGWVPC